MIVSLYRDAIFIMTSNLASDEIANYAEQLRREVKTKMRERYAKIVSEKSNALEKEKVRNRFKRLSLHYFALRVKIVLSYVKGCSS